MANDNQRQLFIYLLFLKVKRISSSSFFLTGKFAFFKAIVIGDPTPTVTWSRNNGDVSDTSRYQTKYDPNSNEHTFEASDRDYRITVIQNSIMLI